MTDLPEVPPEEQGDERPDAAEEGFLPEQRPAADDDAGSAPTLGADQDGAALRAQLAERTDDLQRLQAEYVNYRKRVERDRLVARDQTVVAVVEAILPVLDDIDAARAHGELDGTPFAAVAEKLEGVLTRFGWSRYGTEGEDFDPQVHEALSYTHADDAATTSVTHVLQAGHRVGDRILRAARVAVVGPEN